MKMNNQTSTTATAPTTAEIKLGSRVEFFVTSTAGTRGKTITAKDKRAARTIYNNLTGCGFKNCKVSAQ